MKKNRLTKVMAILALFGIIIGIVGTGLLIMFGGQNTTTQTLTQEEYEQLQELINSQSGAIEVSTGEVEINNSTGEIEVQTENIETGTGKTK